MIYFFILVDFILGVVIYLILIFYFLRMFLMIYFFILVDFIWGVVILEIILYQYIHNCFNVNIF